MATELEIFDPAQSIERVGGNKLLAIELFSMLLKELPGYLEKIRHHSQKGDTAGLKETIHSLNGSIAYCGVPALKAIARECETTINHGQPEEHNTIVEMVMDEIEHLLTFARENTLPLLFSSV